MAGRDRWIAVLVVVVAQWMLFNLLRTVGPATGQDVESLSLRVRYITRAEALPPSPQSEVQGTRGIHVSGQRGPAPARLRSDTSTRPETGKDAGQTGKGPLRPLSLELPNSHVPDFSRQVLKGDTRLDRFAAPPARIPMRKPLTGKDVIEGTAQTLGFWPPGYTTDPCPRIRRNIDEWKTDGSAAGRERLEQEMARQARYCP